MRVTGIFTGISDSPSSSLRQCRDRYAIRAGRNLPDKEFRYLRTVIVTAAVYRGFGLKLRDCSLTSPLNLPAPGRRQALYVVLTTLQSPVFLVNSRRGHFSAAFRGCGGKPHDLKRRPFSRSYGANWPSSLTRIHSSALGFSPCVPVSVYGTDTTPTPYEAFLGSVG